MKVSVEFDGNVLTQAAMTRSEYLYWRKAWKENYSKLSKNIREAKQEIKEAHRMCLFGQIASLTLTYELLRDTANQALRANHIKKLVAAASRELVLA